ncbi:uncharacterized protein [Rutidosis leptorrhynchoides]|uniref:uncharacterized protein n=1 Tax=Rutidosis leptorrhynchoides TaxID=125765 RepID=UPI003A99723A
MGRSPCCDKTKVKRGPWSPEEYAILRNHILNHGTGANWIALPQKAGLKRCGKSCRLRWLNYLRPDIKLGGFTEEEDNIIYSLYSKIGSRWSVIASRLQGRTDNDVKNHWNTKLKKKASSSNNSTITATSGTCATSNSISPLQFSSPVIFPKQEDDHNQQVMDNYLLDYYMMLDYQQPMISNSNANTNIMSSHQENNQGLSPYDYSFPVESNDYDSWCENGGGVTDSANDLLMTGGFDLRQLGEVVNYNYSSRSL